MTGSTPAPGDPRHVDRADFATLVMDALRESSFQYEVEYDAERFELKFLEGGQPKSGVTFLHNVYEEFLRADDETRPLCIRRFVGGIIESRAGLPDDLAEAKPDLRPKLWSRATIAHLQLDMRLRGEDPTKAPGDDDGLLIGEHLLAAVAYDRPDSVASVSTDQLKDWGISLYEALEVARENLAAVPFSFAQLDGGLYLINNQDAWDAARLLLPNLIDQLELNGAPVALVASRDLLLIAGEDDTDSLGAMLRIGAEAAADPRALSPLPLVWRNGEWRDWIVPDGHPLAMPLKHAAVQFIGGEYHRQKEMLDAINEREGHDRFVASFMAAASDEQGTDLFTYAVWPPVPTLLPRADRIALIGGDDEQPEMLGQYPFDKVHEICRDRMMDTGLYPRRWFVKSQPDAAELAKLAPFVVD